MNVRFLDGAQADIEVAASFYEERGNLGSAFLAELQAAMDRILQYPLGWAEIDPGLRRCQLNRFPYGVLYEIREDTLFVVEVLDLRRDPKSWRARLKERAQGPPEGNSREPHHD
jgi:plasmid stabilization system protein ParE